MNPVWPMIRSMSFLNWGVGSGFVRMSASISVVETCLMEFFFVQYGNGNDAGALINVLFEDESCDLLRSQCSFCCLQKFCT